MSETVKHTPGPWLTSDEAIADANSGLWGNKTHRHVEDRRAAERVLRVVRDLEPLSEVYEGSTYGKCCKQYHDDVQAVAEAMVAKLERARR